MGHCSPIGVNDRRLNQLRKIRILDSLTASIIELGASKGLTAMKDFIDSTLGVIPEGSFEEVIDLNAPHKALEALAKAAEERFAAAVTILGDDSLDADAKICYDAGQALELKAETPEEAYRLITENVLDGMPCDDTREIRENTPEKLVWEKTVDTHAEAWTLARGNLSIYYILQKSFIDGMLSTSPISYTIDANTIFTLSKADQR